MIKLLIPLMFIICMIYSQITHNYEHFKEIGIKFQNKLCWLKVNEIDDTIYPPNIYPVRMDCTNTGDKFNVEQITADQYIIKKNKDGKTCSLIYTPTGINWGRGKYNIALSCNPKHMSYNNMTLTNCGTFYKLSPSKRKHCYLTSYNFANPVPLFACHNGASNDIILK